MMKDNYLGCSEGSESISLKDVNSEVRNNKFVGEIIDTLIDPVTGERTEVGHYHNLVVDACSTLIAMVLKGGGSGIQYMAVGSGSSSWANDALPSPTANTVKLVNETFRKAVPTGSMVYIDGSNVVSGTPTNRVQITLTLLEAEANGELRELAFFGGNATATKDSGLMLNHKIHALIYKTSGMQLERVMRFTF